MKYHTFQLSTGYVESASIGNVQISHEGYFSSVTDALYHFGASVQKALEEEIKQHNNDVERRDKEGYIQSYECCSATLLANKTRTLCAKCSRPIRKKEVVVSADEVNSEVEKMIRLTNDEYGYEIRETLGYYGWVVGYEASLPKENEKFNFVDVSVFSWHPSLKEGKVPRGMEWFEYEMTLVKKVYPTWEHGE